MISNTALNTQFSPVVDFQFSTNAVSSNFDKLLYEKSTTNYDKLTEWAKGFWGKTVIHEIDASKINGLDRKDFPEALLFQENMTLEELNKQAPAYPEPKDNLDPRVLRAGRAACRQNGVAILVSPAAIEKMNRDEEFFDYVMAQLEESLYPSIQQSMMGLPRTYTHGNFEITSTDCSLIIKIDENGKVDGKLISTGVSKRIDDDEEEAEETEFYFSEALNTNENSSYPALRHSVDETETPVSYTSQEFEYLYDFLGSFNFAASEKLIEHRKRR